MDLNYYETLISVAGDCPVTSSVVPAARGGKRTVAVVQHELIAGSPYGLTQEDILFETWLRRQDLLADPPDAERAELRDRFFTKPQACLRSSPLPKKYGWGLLFDRKGRVSVCPMESPEYERLIADAGREVKILQAFRSRRA